MDNKRRLQKGEKRDGFGNLFCCHFWGFVYLVIFFLSPLPSPLPFFFTRRVFFYKPTTPQETYAKEKQTKHQKQQNPFPAGFTSPSWLVFSSPAFYYLTTGGERVSGLPGSKCQLKETLKLIFQGILCPLVLCFSPTHPCESNNPNISTALSTLLAWFPPHLGFGSLAFCLGGRGRGVRACLRPGSKFIC